MTRSKSIWATIVLGLILWGPIPAAAVARVLVIHSYHEQYDWVQGINEALKSHFKSDVDYRIIYMDTKRKPSEDWKMKAARNAKKVITEFKPEVVIAVDDNAQKYVVSEYVGKSPIQFVFCGVNADPTKYGYPASNVTGILERAYPGQVLQMLKKIAPRIKNVAWVSDDSATVQVLLPRVRAMAESRQLPLDIVEYAQPATFAQWKQRIDRLDRDPDINAFLIPLYHTVKSNIGKESVSSATVMNWTVTHTGKPIVGFWPFSTDDGALCAVAVDPYEHGKVAALMAKQILAGKRAADIPMVINQNGYVILNLKSAHYLGIEVPFEVIQSADKIIE